MTTKERCDQACAILAATDDGEALDPRDLKLVEVVVNGFVNEEGEEVFRLLHRRVTEGTYRKPWFHDVENLTIDHVGYVYWRGRQVEHFTPSWAYSEEARKAAEELGSHCRLLENMDFPVTLANIFALSIGDYAPEGE